MLRHIRTALHASGLTLIATLVACQAPADSSPATSVAAQPASHVASSNASSNGSSNATSALVARGEYIVNMGLCNDCHTPKVFGPNGPVLDTTRLLSGHLATEPMPAMPKGIIAPGKWGAATNGSLTGWVGAWGTSYAANLTPHETGLKAWTADDFIATMRTGKHLGVGRPILPPMPWELVGKWTDDDLRAAFAYLQSLTPINNRVPLPEPPVKQ